MEDSEISFFLKYLPMEVTLRSLGTAKLPAFLGSTLRGVIGQALHQNKEAYNYLYNNRTLDGNMQDIVNPYVILSPDMEQDTYLEGDELHFKILLLGEAMQYVQQLVHAIQGISYFGLGASRYPFELVKVVHDLDQRVIWKDGLFYDISARSVILPYRCLPEVQQLHLQTLTPLRIRRKGELLSKLDFPTIIRNITRRMEMITERYGGWCDRTETERLRILSTEVVVLNDQLKFVNLERYSNRLGEKMDFSGLMGDIWFEGTLTPFVPWLYAAQVLHFGRNTTFGMGRMKVEFI